MLSSPTSSVNIAELKRKSSSELGELADTLGAENDSGFSKQDLIFRIEQRLLDRGETLTGEMVVQLDERREHDSVRRNAARLRFTPEIESDRGVHFQEPQHAALCLGE